VQGKTMQIVTKTDIAEYKLLSRGKVRDIYEVDAETLLIVTTDRMSAFDVIMGEPIPYKGVILNSITLFWMERFADLVPNHLIASDVKDFPQALHKYADMLEGRAVLVRKAAPLPVECIVRGHITGSGWKDYQKTGMVCGHSLPAGLVESAKLETPLFTPSTKAELGEHDENISVQRARELVGDDVAAQIERLSIEIFSKGREYAESRGIIIADTKFEFGIIDGAVILIDEVLTPDSSRFWPVQGYQPGKSQPSFDKQYLRDWLSAQDWDKTPPAPALPQDVITETRNKYAEAYSILTGKTLNL
jgi:phosphoribosylaminoimidazole-succinocarboxamide synthase